MSGHGLRFLEDYRPGASYEVGEVSFDEAGIVAFAREYDPQPFHIDPAAAASGPFGGLIASGWQTAGLVTKCFVENYLSPEGSMGGLGFDELRWPHPVRPGDTLRATVTVVQARRSVSKPDRGIVTSRIEAVNQDGQTVITGTAINIVRARPGPA